MREETEDRFFHVILEDRRGRRMGVTVNAEDEAKAMDLAEDRTINVTQDTSLHAVLCERI